MDRGAVPRSSTSYPVILSRYRLHIYLPAKHLKNPLGQPVDFLLLLLLLLLLYKIVLF